MKNKLCSVALLLIYCANARSGVLDSFYPQIEKDRSFWLSIDFLSFVPKEKAVVLTNKMTDLFTTADVTLQPVIKPRFKWDFGYRLGFGYLLQDSAWDMAINLTHFKTGVCQNRSTHGDIGLGMFPIWSLANDILRYDWVAKAKLRWHLDLNLLDIDFGRAFSWRERFFLRLLMGLRAAWVDQDFDIRYGGGIFANGLDLPALDSTFGYDSIDMKNNFWGIGPRLGIEPQINLTENVRLYSTACATLDYGIFDIWQKEIYLKSVRFERNCHRKRIAWIVDATAGLMWKRFCCEERYALTVALGWEFHRFFKQIELQRDAFGLVSKDRTLSLNGLAVSARFNF